MSTTMVINKGSGTAGCTCGRCSQAQKSDPMEGREVVGLGLTARNPDGTGGEVKKFIRHGPASKQEYMPVRSYYAEPRLDATKRAELEGRLAGIAKELANPATLPVQRIRLEQEQATIERVLGRTNEEDARK